MTAGNVISKNVLDNHDEMQAFLNASASSISLATSTAFATEPALCFAAACAIAPVAVSFILISLVKPKKMFVPLLIITPPFIFGMSIGAVLRKNYKAAGAFLCGSALLTAIPVMAYYGVDAGSPTLIGGAAILAGVQCTLTTLYALDLN